MTRPSPAPRRLRPPVAALALAAFIAAPAPASADEYRLPDSQELSRFSPEALQFYSAGTAALDRSDDLNAYHNLAKAAMLQPEAVRLNLMAGALAQKRGRNARAAEAANHYETALAAFRNVLAHPDIEDALRRETENRVRVAQDERDNLEQRDANRDARGFSFVQQLNKQYNEKAKADKAREERAAKGVPSPTPAPPVGAQLPPGSAPLVPNVGAPGAYPSNTLTPGVPITPYPAALPTPASAGGPEGGPLRTAPGIPGVPGQSGVAPPGPAPAGPPNV